MLGVAKIVVGTFFTNGFCDAGRTMGLSGDMGHLLFPLGDLGAVVVSEPDFFGDPEAGIFQQSVHDVDAIALQHVEAVFQLGDVRHFFFVGFFDFAHHPPTGVVVVYFDVFDLELLPFAGTLRVAVLVDEPAFSNEVGGVLHVEVMGEEPELAVAEVEVGYLGGGGHC